MKNLIENELMEEVITYDGIPALRKDCRFIKGKFYIKNKQCFYIDGKWYRTNSNQVVFDHEKQGWVLKNTVDLKSGVINVTSDNKVEIGSFSANNENNVKLYKDGDLLNAISVEIFRNNSNIKEGMNGHYYFQNDSHIPKEFTNKMRPRKDNFYSFPFNYGSEELIPSFSHVHSERFVGQPLLSKAYKYIENYTFGVEFETDRGAIPEKYLKKNGLIACRDGSITGFEYTTIPLQGERGIQTIKSVCSLLKQFCGCSPNESLHIHLGGYPKDLKSLASLYRLGLVIQKEIYSLFPYYYVNTAEFKRKSYCGPLPHYADESTDAKEIFSALYYWLSNGSNFTRFPTGTHPMDKSGQHKWDISPR